MESAKGVELIAIDYRQSYAITVGEERDAGLLASL
jgi:hypothetical protein